MDPGPSVGTVKNLVKKKNRRSYGHAACKEKAEIGVLGLKGKAIKRKSD